MSYPHLWSCELGFRPHEEINWIHLAEPSVAISDCDASKLRILSEVEFVEAAMDEQHIGPARAIADPGLWQ